MTTMMSGTLAVPGAVLHHESRGRGPVLLIAQSGEGDAGRSADLVSCLGEGYTVVTYDRRGLSRSPLDDPGRGVALEDHVDDAHRLLAALTDRPARMLGCSLGAAIGLHLAVRYPGQLDTLIAHEPIVPMLLPAAERIRQARELVAIQTAYRSGGLPAAIPEITGALGIDPGGQDVEPDLTPQPMTPQRLTNFDFFIEHDIAAVLGDTRELTVSADGVVRIVPAVGRATPHTVFDRRCAVELAALLGAGVEEFPGGHNGNTTHPRAYAARVRDLLHGDP